MNGSPGLLARTSRRFPDWLKKNVHPGFHADDTQKLLKSLQIHTICRSGRCPNRDECFSHKTAAFMILGDVCTRRCAFCAVSSGQPFGCDEAEPMRISQAVKVLGIRHAVITSVTRDDLGDEGAGQFVSVIKALRAHNAGVTVEVLTPDFRRTQAWAAEIIGQAGPDVFNHNLETVLRLYKTVRPQADYHGSLNLLKIVSTKFNKILTKSGIMLGLGETREDILKAFEDLLTARCRMLTIGQYLQPHSQATPVLEYIHPDVFDDYKTCALKMGFDRVESGPYVRSSFHAQDSFLGAVRR